jgi:iron-sulfur cluster assembly protein
MAEETMPGQKPVSVEPSTGPLPAPGETVCVAGIGAGQKAIPGKSGLSIGDRAYERLKALLEERKTPEAGLRVAVRGGGCSGLSYNLTWDEQSREKDRIFERDGVRVFVDPKSYIYLVGTVIEYEEKLLQSGFKLTNPQVRSTCGCGESFTV